MSLNLNSLIEAAIQTQDVDMTETGTGGGGLMPAGFAMARLVTYIEFGSQPQEYQGKAKAPADEFRVGFKLFGGEYDGRFISTFDLALSNNEKSAAKILFERLNWKGDLKHIAQALKRGFLVPITVVKSKTSGKDGNRINIAGILPPIDVVSKAQYPIPEVEDSDLKYFFFNSPTPETWNALFVDGTWDDGGSKNKIQEKILTALNFQGSALEQQLSGTVLPDLTPDAPVVAEKPAEAAVATPAVTPTLAMPVMPTMPAMPS